MDKLFGSLQCAVLGIALLMVGLYTTWVTALEGPPIHLADCLRTMQQSDSIREDRAVLLRSIQVDEDIYARLAVGRLSLTEAADALREEVESRPPHLRQPINSHERTLPRREIYMLRLLARMEDVLARDPRQDELVRRLRAEMQAYQATRTFPVPTNAPHTLAAVEAR